MKTGQLFWQRKNQMNDIFVKEKKSLESASFSLRNKLTRLLWCICYYSCFRFIPIQLFKVRYYILKLFGAKIHKSVRIYPSVKIWLPSNLKMGKNSTLGPNANIYNQGTIYIGKGTIVSQGAHICASTHNYNDRLHPLVLSPIKIDNHVWICTEAFIGPGVTIQKGGVIGARSVVLKDTVEWSVYTGNPAIRIKSRNEFHE